MTAQYSILSLKSPPTGLQDFNTQSFIISKYNRVDVIEISLDIRVKFQTLRYEERTTVLMCECKGFLAGSLSFSLSLSLSHTHTHTHTHTYMDLLNERRCCVVAYYI